MSSAQNHVPRSMGKSGYGGKKGKNMNQFDEIDMISKKAGKAMTSVPMVRDSLTLPEIGTA